MARTPDIKERIEQWFCNAPSAEVQEMLVFLRRISMARGVNWPEPHGKRKYTRRGGKDTVSAVNQSLLTDQELKS